NTGGTTPALTANDTLNGNPVVIGTNAGEVTLTGVSVPSGLTLNADGTLSIAANTPAGNYTVSYTICEVTNASNCSTVSSIVVVTPASIAAITETTTPINGNTGGTTPALTANDTLNGNPVVIGTNAGEVTLTGVSVPSGLTLNADGTLSIAANTPAGNYTVSYTICEVTNTSNCSTVSSIIVVSAASIAAITETTTPINGNTGGTTPALTANDTLNGNPVVIGTNAGEVTLTGVSVPSGLTLNADGTLSIAANTPAGNYTVSYTICEVTNASNCSTVSSTIAVSAASIAAITETTTPINGNTGGTTPALTANDTLNGNPVVIGTSAGEVTLTGVSVPSGLTLNADGTLSIAANTPAGNYTVSYTICEVTNASNCSTVSSTIAVTPASIAAITETTTPINGNTGGTTPALTANDTLNGNPVVIGTNAGEVTLTGVSVPSGLTLNADGTLSIAANTPAGNYTVSYTICEVTNASNCSTVSSTVAVTAASIAAITETTTPINGNTGGTTPALTANDTLNGNPVVIGTNAGEVTLTGVSVPSGLTLNADGTLSIAANTPAGNYTVSYTICEVTNTSNCSTVSSTIVVNAASIAAITETTTPINGNTGGTTPALTANDTLNGNPVVIGTNAGEVTLTGVSVPSGLTLNADGTLSIAANTPAGNYTVSYTICEVTNTSNCSTVSSTIVVTAASIAAITETTTPINGNTGGTTPALTANDTLNGNPVVIGTNAGEVTLTGVSVPSGLTLNTDGTLSIAANTPAGNYTVSYTICEVTNTSNCSTVSSIISVGQSSLNAIEDDFTTSPINGITGGITQTVFENDLQNGKFVNVLDFNLQVVGEMPKGFSLNANGTITVAPNTTGGNYMLMYEICDKLNSSNCSTAKVLVFVEVPSIAIIKTAVFNDENSNGNADAGETITYNFKVTNTGNILLHNITVSDPLPGIIMSGSPIDLDVNDTDEVSFSAQYSITQNDINIGSVSNQASVMGSTLSGIKVEDKSDNINNLGDNPTVLLLSGCVIKIFNAVSINGDSMNERFYIQGIECYPDNTVQIYNRWGVLVFERDHYNNTDVAFR
ncbi:gliding motility-associated C-terminal domain-containing protein, partial [Flavobacterium sp. Fl-77]